MPPKAQATTTEPTTGPAGVTVPVEPDPKTEEPKGKTFTEDDIERARREEKEKLYPDLETTRTELAQTRQELEEMRKWRERQEQAEKERAQQLAAEEEARRQEQEQEMSARELLESREQEWNQRFQELQNTTLTQLQSLQQQNAQQAAILEREREFQALQEYRSRRLVEMENEIHPIFRDLVKGTSPEEIESSLADMAKRSESILGEVQATLQQTRQVQRGVQPTAPPIGPMDQVEGTRTFTAEELASMPLDEYEKHRPSLLRAASASRTGGGQLW